MRKVIFLAMIVGELVSLLTPQVASAQTRSIYAVKFVCGRQAPTDATLPAEPPVKPGNYATKINVELLFVPGTPITGGSSVASWNVSIAGVGVNTPEQIVLTQLQTVDFTCADIARRVAFPAGAPPPQFINGYVNIIANPGVVLAVTGVYTSQGCFFGQSGDSQGPPICTGPVSIEVVPETAIPVPVS
jgi:hypothetical protein